MEITYNVDMPWEQGEKTALMYINMAITEACMLWGITIAIGSAAIGMMGDVRVLTITRCQSVAGGASVSFLVRMDTAEITSCDHNPQIMKNTFDAKWDSCAGKNLIESAIEDMVEKMTS